MESETPAARVVLTIQKEVAERIIAGPGDMSLLALSVQVFGVPTIEAHISASSFFPVPKVESSVLRIDMHSVPNINQEHIDTLFKLARAGFGQKRKQLKNALAHGLPISKSDAESLLEFCGIEPRTRAEVLSVGDWFCLAEAYEQTA
jgi:16S rRNA (adenine1518-N6/adenine1519-N6)-dimethyltransferase